MAYARGLTEIDGNFKTEARLVAANVVIDSLVHIDGVPFNVDVADGGEGIPLDNGLFANPVLTSPFTIRESFLDNPLVHLYTKNDLVRVLAGSSELASDRNTIATRVDINGIVRDVDIDDPREEETGWLFEGESENLVIRSDEFDDAAWVKSSGLTVTPNATSAPDGTLTADKLIPPNNTGTARDVRQGVLGVNQGTFSVYLKKSEFNFVSILLLGRNATGGVFEATIDLTTKAQNLISGSGALIVESLANDWLRVSVSTTAIVGSTDIEVRVTVVNSLTDTVITGDGVSGVFAWRGEFKDLPFASSGIKTVATTVTRSADDQSFPSAENFRESEGAIFLRADVIGDTGGSQYLFDITDGTGNNRIRLFRSLDKIQIVITNGGTVQVNISTSFDMEVGQQYEIAINYKDDDVELFVDGVSIGTDVFVNMPTGLTTIDMGQNFAQGDQLFGHIQDLRFYPENLTIAEIKHLGSN